jgi:hypothetical protein
MIDYAFAAAVSCGPDYSRLLVFSGPGVRLLLHLRVHFLQTRFIQLLQKFIYGGVRIIH